MSKYDAVAQRALKTITRKGETVVFDGGTTGQTLNPLTNRFTPGTVTPDARGKAIQIEGDPERLVAQNVVVKSPVTLLVAGKGLTVRPVSGMRFTWAGSVYTIVDTDPFAPDGSLVILWTITGTR